MWDENHLLQVVSIFFLIRNFFIQQFCTGAVLYQYTGFYLQKATTFSCSPNSPGRELQPPQLLYQPIYLLVLGDDLQKATTFTFLPGTTFHQFSNWIHKYQTNIKYMCINQSPFRKQLLNQPITSQNVETRKQYQ